LGATTDLKKINHILNAAQNDDISAILNAQADRDALLASQVAVVAALLAVTCLLFTSVAKEFASAPNVGNAPKNSSALVLKLAGSCLVGGVGSNVIAMFFLYVKLSISMLHLLNVG
jgi:uncharacterized protein YgbK (DUF1537 family)